MNKENEDPIDNDVIMTSYFLCLISKIAKNSLF